MQTVDRFWEPIPAPGNIIADYCLAVLEMVSYTNDANRVAEWAQIFGLTRHGRVTTPGRVIPNFVYAGTDTKLIIAIPGTTDAVQMVNNIVYSGQRENPDFGPGLVHSFFLWCAESIISFLGNATNTFPGLQEITFVGHSLGGAVAQLLADWTVQNTAYNVKLCVTFNCPRIGDEAWANRVRTFPLHNYYCTHDLVCELPTNILPMRATSATQIGRLIDFSHRDTLIPIQSQQSIEESWIAIAISKVVYPLKWTLSTLSSTATAATAMRAMGFIGSRAALASWVLPLPVWWNEHKMRTVLQNIEATSVSAPFAERQAIRILSDLLVATDGTPSTVNPFPFALAPPALFDWTQVSYPGGVADLPPVAPGTRTEVIEAALDCDLSADDVPQPNLISVDDAFIQALTTAASASPSTSPLQTSNPIVIPAAPRPHYFFRGNDRRLLEKLSECARLIDARDLKIGNLAPTSAISNREEILDSFDAELLEQWGQIQNRADFLLSLAYDD